MIRLSDLQDLKWIGLLVFVTIFGLKIYLTSNDFIGIILTAIGFASYLTALVIDITRKVNPRILWDGEQAVVAIIRNWTIEVAAARMLTSVPVGIDLSHSARKVLGSLYTRFMNEPEGTLSFFIRRPIGDYGTRVGFLVRRKVLRGWNSASQISSLVKKVTTDAMILERSMRAAYPHLPVGPAEFQDIITIRTGGLETHALV